MYRGTGASKEAVAPALLAMVVLLQGYQGISEAEAVEMTVFDLRWQLVLDLLGATEPAFSQGALCAFRVRLICHDTDSRLLERTVACNSNADCTTYVDDSHCDCFDPVYGVNIKNTIKCFASPCAPLLDADGGIYTCPANTSGLYAQNCQFVPDSQSIAVACRNHQCFTYAVATGSE
jgi:hypothetical protein